jgi:hypothetical protein
MVGVGQGDQKIKGKICPILGKSSQNSCQTKKYQSILIKAQFESPIYLQQTTSKLLKCKQ